MGGFNLKNITAGIGKQLTPAHILTSTVKTAGNVSAAAVGATTQSVTAVIGGAGQVLTAARPVLQQATQLAAENPALAGALGIPSGLLGGGASPASGGYSAYQPAAPAAADNTLLYVGIGAAILVLFLVMRKS